MTECRTPELQDLLPDFVAESLAHDDRVRVTAHLAECAACTADMAILRIVRAAPHAVSSIDVAQIVAALPRPASATPVMNVHRGAMVSPPRRSAVEASTRSPWLGPQVWRMAATIAVVLAGGFSVLVARRGSAAFDAASDALQVVASNSVAPGRTAVGTTTASATPAESASASGSGTANTARDSHATVTVSYGALDNATESEIQALIDRLEKWDGATSAEPAPSMPVVSSRGGSEP